MTSSVPLSNADSQCTFDLKFDMSESNECLTQSLDLFGRSQSPTSQQIDAEGDQGPHNKKRKMDKDGFITPATPDVSKACSQYPLSSHSHFERQSDGGGDRGDAQNENGEDEFVDTRQAPHASQGSDVVSTFSQESDKPRYDKAADLFEDVAQGTKMFIIQMAQSFRESEEYEAECLQKVENLLAEARAQEENLRHQKDVLQQRLFMIGRRLLEADQ